MLLIDEYSRIFQALDPKDQRIVQEYLDHLARCEARLESRTEFLRTWVFGTVRWAGIGILVIIGIAGLSNNVASENLEACKVEAREQAASLRVCAARNDALQSLCVETMVIIRGGQ